VYSDLAITGCLTLGMIYRQPLRQTEGLVPGLILTQNSIASHE